MAPFAQCGTDRRSLRAFERGLDTEEVEVQVGSRQKTDPHATPAGPTKQLLELEGCLGSAQDPPEKDKKPEFRRYVSEVPRGRPNPLSGGRLGVTLGGGRTTWWQRPSKMTYPTRSDSRPSFAMDSPTTPRSLEKARQGRWPRSLTPDTPAGRIAIGPTARTGAGFAGRSDPEAAH
jgi:hypothetical protein